ncbi:class II glutamine amidotransferase [Acetanaerobacterium elongatum]|uniref:Glutamate synthase (NADPH) GltB1 subunit n=1 Tax=Acetanaerobacterium elongatum TaxID=258515 RepID=A0A1G9XTW3_9FIRM|nr:glutamate synthase (NADPH) GltB1 subunit [Acetanaerobacterium elongatum]
MQTIPREGEVRIPSGCAISGIFSKSGKRLSGEGVIKSIATMHDRSNGLGGGFAGYGIYPQHKDLYAFHIFYENKAAKQTCEEYLAKRFEIADCGEIPVKKMLIIKNEPLIWRYFMLPLPKKLEHSLVDEKEFVAQVVTEINTKIQGAFVFSSGKNMGVFKAVGFPEDVGEYYRLEEYSGYCWTAHGRYPTNTPGWWGGAHPFALLDYSIVHNGEISSYDANRRCIEMFGYKCTLLTDTEAITYIIDYLVRKVGLTLEEVASVIAAPFWKEIDRLPEEEKARLTYLRNAFAGMLITGPFSILLGFEGGMMALNDRLKLRSMVVGEKDDMVYIASEECAIRVIEPNVDRIWAPKGGQPVIVTLNGGVR